MQTPTETPLGGALRSQQTAEWLLQQLRSGQLAGAVQLPSEQELAGMLGVSRTVVRDALSVLERAGYMERVRGIGTLVNREVLEADNRLDQKIEFYSMIRAAGYEPHSDTVSVTRETAAPALAKRLALPAGQEHTLVFVRRRVLAGDRPVLHSTDIFPLALLGGRRPDTLAFTQPIFTLLQTICGLEVTKTLAHLRAVPGPPAVRRQLELRADQALMQLDETCYTRLCQPVLCCRTLYTDFFDFSIVRKLL